MGFTAAVGVLARGAEGGAPTGGRADGMGPPPMGGGTAWADTGPSFGGGGGGGGAAASAAGGGEAAAGLAPPAEKFQRKGAKMVRHLVQRHFELGL